MSSTSEPQQVYAIVESDGAITDLVLSEPNTSTQESITYEGAVKNIGDGLYYAAFDSKGIRHKLELKDGKIVTDDGKSLKQVFTKEPDNEAPKETIKTAKKSK